MERIRESFQVKISGWLSIFSCSGRTVGKQIAKKTKKKMHGTSGDNPPHARASAVHKVRLTSPFSKTILLFFAFYHASIHFKQLLSLPSILALPFQQDYPERAENLYNLKWHKYNK